MMKKILIIVPSLNMGGMERVCINYANLLDQRGYSVTIINFTSHDETLIKELSSDVKYIYNFIPVPHIIHAKIADVVSLNFRVLRFNQWIKYHSAQYLYKHYVKEEYDIEIAFYGGQAIKIISGSTNAKASRIGWIHGSTIEKHFQYFRSFKEAYSVYNKIQKIVCVSKDIQDKLISILERNNDIYTIHNPNDTKRILKLSTEPIDIDKQEGIITFVMVSRIDFEVKGIDRLIYCVEKLNSIGLKFELWIIGDGLDFEKLQNTIQYKKLDNVKLLGIQYNPYKYMAKADIYICSSLYEGFSMAMAEALILGKPILTTKVSGSYEMLGNNEYGLVVENSSQGILEGMTILIKDNNLVKHYQQKAIERSHFFDEAEIIDFLERLF